MGNLLIISILTFLSPKKDLKEMIIEKNKVSNTTQKISYATTSTFSIPLEQRAFWSSLSLPESLVSLWGAHFIDIDGDGYPEVINVYENVAYLPVGKVYLYRNHSGNIDPSPSWASAEADRFVQADFGDYDNDGDLDMAVAAYIFLGGTTKIYRNENGMFTTYAVWVGGSGTWCGWGDMDNDGDLDLAMVDIGEYPRVFRNNNGVIETTPCWIANDFGVDLGGAWADVDNDGDLDLLVGTVSLPPPTLRIYYNSQGMLETSASWKSEITGAQNYGIGIFPADIDKDGDLDILVSSGFVEYQTNCIFINRNGDIEKIPSWYSNDMEMSGSCVCGDLNNDGFLDWGVNNDRGVVYENINGYIHPSYAWWSYEPGVAISVDLGDIDRDGILIKEDTLTGDGNRKLFYFSKIPIQRILEVKINNSPVPLSDYCYHLRYGWITFKNPPPQGSQITLKYEYSIDLDFLLADYPNNQSHIYRNYTINVFEKDKLSPQIIFLSPILKNTLYIYFPLSSSLEISIYNLSGQKKFYKKFEISENIFYFKIPSNLSKGIYFLLAQTQNKIFKFKFIKTK